MFPLWWSRFLARSFNAMSSIFQSTQQQWPWWRLWWRLEFRFIYIYLVTIRFSDGECILWILKLQKSTVPSMQEVFGNNVRTINDQWYLMQFCYPLDGNKCGEGQCFGVAGLVVKECTIKKGDEPVPSVDPHVGGGRGSFQGWTADCQYHYQSSDDSRVWTWLFELWNWFSLRSCFQQRCFVMYHHILFPKEQEPRHLEGHESFESVCSFFIRTVWVEFELDKTSTTTTTNSTWLTRLVLLLLPTAHDEQRK